MKKLFFDMDGVLVDFQSGIDKLSEETKREYEGRLDEVPGIFSLMDPMPGAIEAVHELSEYYDIYILSTAPWNNLTAPSDKIQWLTKHFGDLFKKRVILRTASTWWMVTTSLRTERKMAPANSLVCGCNSARSATPTGKK